jgi:predicted RNA-binding protein YlqC (UPF0109 family)
MKENKMDLDVQELVLTIVKPLVADPNAVKIEVTDGDEFTEFHLHVAASDMGRIIGKQGRIIHAIRTIVYSVPVEGKKIRLLVDK